MKEKECQSPTITDLGYINDHETKKSLARLAEKASQNPNPDVATAAEKVLKNLSEGESPEPFSVNTIVTTPPHEES